MQLNIDPIWKDNDDETFMRVRLSLQGAGRESWSEAYCYPEQFLNFGQALADFPTSISHQVKLELGSTDQKTTEHLVLRAFVHDAQGHCALEFSAESRGDALVASSFRFAVPAEAASLNELGRKLAAWSASAAGSFTYAGTGY